MMFARSFVLGLAGALSVAISSAWAQTCTGSSSTGTAPASSPFWLQSITHQGNAPYAASGYSVFRNVKDYGAKGDGVTDDTAAINSAMSSGGRCGGGSCLQSTTTPALIYFPAGTYVVSAPITMYYYSQMIGDAKNLPTLKATAGFAGIAVIDADPYLAGGANWFVNQNNFFKSVRNFVIDIRAVTSGGTGIHWQVSQATSLANVRFEMSTASSTSQQGMFMENGSGGMMNDLIFNGGKYGLWLGNQQFTVRNVTINNAQTAVFGDWNWGWNFQSIKINNCGVGFDLLTGGLTKDTQSVGGETLVDVTMTNVPIGIRSSVASGGSLKGSLVLNNLKTTNVPIIVGVSGGATVLSGSTGVTNVAHWVQGNVYKGTSQAKTFVQAAQTAPTKDASLLDSAGNVFSRPRPQYEGYDISQIVSIKSLGAKGDGTTDDTTIIQNALNTYANCKVLFFDHGIYIVTNTITIPPGTRMVGEAWSVIMGSGSAFNNQAAPKVVVQVGAAGSKGVAEITDIIFSTRGPTIGAIVTEFNMAQSSQGSVGLWDTYIRLGGARGTNLDATSCASGTNNINCAAAFLGMHLTATANLYAEGLWVWLADHEMETNNQQQITLFSGRGVLSESQGPVWLIGTGSEHHVLYQYSLVGAKNHYLGQLQTESLYAQPAPAAPAPFTVSTTYKDPVTSQTSGWGLWVQSSTNILVFGAGHYSFFQNYAQTCLDTVSCQSQIVNIDSTSTISIYGLATVGTTYQLSVNQAGVVQQSQNADGFQQTVTSWTRT